MNSHDNTQYFLSLLCRKQGTGDLPDNYLLIQRPDAIRITHILVFVDERGRQAPAGSGGSRPAGANSASHGGHPSTSQPLTDISPQSEVAPARPFPLGEYMGRLDGFTVIIFSYVVWMLLQYALKDRQIRRWLGLS